jgi:hypothetical protein
MPSVVAAAVIQAVAVVIQAVVAMVAENKA